MDIKLQKRREKQKRQYFLSDKPIIRPVREIKDFDNIQDAKQYLTKHWNSIEHNECSVFGSGNSIYGYAFDLDDEDHIKYIELHIKSETTLDQAISLIEQHDFDSDYEMVSSLWVNRVERMKPFKERQELIRKFSAMKTEELLKHRRHTGPAGFYLDGWHRSVLKAILDGREHVPTATDRKNLRKRNLNYKKLINMNQQKLEDHFTNILSDALWEEIDDNQKKAEIVDKLMSVVPFGNINTHTLENLVERVEDFIKDAARTYQAEDIILDLIDSIERSSKDGIGVEVWDSYKAALQFLGEKEKLQKCLEHEYTEGDHGYSGHIQGKGVFE